VDSHSLRLIFGWWASGRNPVVAPLAIQVHRSIRRMSSAEITAAYSDRRSRNLPIIRMFQLQRHFKYNTRYLSTFAQAFISYYIYGATARAKHRLFISSPYVIFKKLHDQSANTKVSLAFNALFKAEKA
jgi:hypothetical protein